MEISVESALAAENYLKVLDERYPHPLFWAMQEHAKT